METGVSMSAPQSNNMSIGSLVAPGIHPDLANDCPLMWSGVDLPLQPRPSYHSHFSETPGDSPFYSSPAETCPSPLSDTTYSLPPHSVSSISSASVSMIDQYPKNILKSELHASPMSMHTPLLHWDGDAGMPPHMVPISMGESMIQPVSYHPPIFLCIMILTFEQPVQCHYPSPSCSGSDYLPYEDQVHSMHHFQPMTWAM